MSDIVERLRIEAGAFPENLFSEAADELEWWRQTYGHITPDQAEKLKNSSMAEPQEKTVTW